MHLIPGRLIALMAALAASSGPAVAQERVRDGGVHVDVLHDLRRELAGVAHLTDQGRDFREEQVDRQTRTLAIGPTGSLDLANLSGDIRVRAGAGSQATVEIVRTSRGRTDADARLGLDEVVVEVIEENGGARVRTRYPENRRRSPYSVSVSYTVTAPAGARLTAHTVSGDVTIDGIEGDVAIDVISGDIGVTGARSTLVAKAVSGDVTIADVETTAGVEVTTINGDVMLRRVRADRLRVNGVSGNITATGITASGADLKSMAGDVSYSGDISGSGRYEFQAHSGDLDLVLSGSAGFDLEARTFNGEIRPASDLQMTNVSTSRRAFRGRVGGGGAVVEATTFSGDIVIRRR